MILDIIYCHLFYPNRKILYVFCSIKTQKEHQLSPLKSYSMRLDSNKINPDRFEYQSPIEPENNKIEKKPFALSMNYLETSQLMFQFSDIFTQFRSAIH